MRFCQLKVKGKQSFFKQNWCGSVLSILRYYKTHKKYIDLLFICFRFLKLFFDYFFCTGTCPHACVT